MAEKSAQGIDCRFISKLQGTPPKEVVYLRKDDVVSLIRHLLPRGHGTNNDIVELAETLERIER